MTEVSPQRNGTENGTAAAPTPAVKREESPLDRSLEGLVELKTSKRDEALDPMETIAQKCIALHLHSMGISFTQSALEHLFDLMEINLNTMLTDLQKVTQTQRRAKASPRDLRMLLRDYDMRTGELEEEFLKTKKLPSDIIAKKEALEKMAEELTKSNEEEETIEPQNPAFVFFAHDEDIIRLVPPMNKGNAAILPWLPQLPPDHTYRRTPKYTDRITDQKIVRTKIYEESKLGEQALDHLSKATKRTNEELEYDDDSNEELKSTEDAPETTHEQKAKLAYDIFSTGQGKSFDIELYARARLEFLERKKAKKEKKVVDKDAELKRIVSSLSPYAKESEEPVTAPAVFLDRQFKKTIHTFKALRKAKEAREEKKKILKEEARKKREEMKKNEPTFEDFDNFDKMENLDFENFENFGDSNKSNVIMGEGDGDKDDDGVELLSAERYTTTITTSVPQGSDLVLDGDDSEEELETNGNGHHQSDTAMTSLPLSSAPNPDAMAVDDDDVDDIVFDDVV